MLGSIVNVKQSRFNFMYRLAQTYYNFYGNLEVPCDFKTNDGINYADDGENLSAFIYGVRASYKNMNKIDKLPHGFRLNKERIQMLDEIVMVWDPNEKRFLEMYGLAKAYYEFYGNLEVPSNFRTNDGINIDKKGKKLGLWICELRGEKKAKLTKKMIDLLNEIEMVWDLNEKRFLEMYELAKAYYEFYGNLDISSNFRTNDGINYAKNGKEIGLWVVKMRYANAGTSNDYISKSQKERLNKIGMIWDYRKYSYNVKYSLAETYYKSHGNLNVPKGYKIEYNNKYYNISNWISSLREAYKGAFPLDLDDKKIKQLDDIEMVWFSDKTDKKLQSEVIDSRNLSKKRIEILNRCRSYLNTIKDTDLKFETSEDIQDLNEGFVKYLEIRK